MNMTSEQLTDMTKNSDVIVFTAGAAGSGVDRTSMIDGLGPVKMIEAAAANGIKRIYLVSAFPESARNDNLGAAFEHYMRVKKEADVAVANSGLDWVIIRPGTLLHADADNHVTLGSAIQYGTVKRGNVASVIAKLIDTPTIRREVLELTDGDISVDEAVNKISHLRLRKFGHSRRRKRKNMPWSAGCGPNQREIGEARVKEGLDWREMCNGRDATDSKAGLRPHACCVGLAERFVCKHCGFG